MSYHGGLISKLNQVTITITRPVLLQGLESRLSARTEDTKPQAQISSLAVKLSEACVKHARSSCQLLVECWIDGSFPIFDYSYTQYLFSAATVLAVSGFIKGMEFWSDKDLFESAAQFLAQQKENGNFAAEEFCHYIDGMSICMAALQSHRAQVIMPGNNLQRPDGINTTSPSTSVDISLALFQESWSQSDLDLCFSDESIYHDDTQGLHRAGMSPEDLNSQLLDTTTS